MDFAPEPLCRVLGSLLGPEGCWVSSVDGSDDEEEGGRVTRDEGGVVWVDSELEMADSMSDLRMMMVLEEDPEGEIPVVALGLRPGLALFRPLFLLLGVGGVSGSELDPS